MANLCPRETRADISLPYQATNISCIGQKTNFLFVTRTYKSSSSCNILL